MRFRPLGESGISASAVGLGTWAIGGWMWGGADEATSLRAIGAALDAGVNLIDTAPVYGLGLAETLVGKAIAGRRDKVVLATKCGLVWDTEKGTPFVQQQDKLIRRHLGAESIRYELERSLKRLGTDYVDLYQTHWQDAATPIEETMEALLELKEQGKIRAIGVSNCSLDQLQQYDAVGPVDCAQEKYSMLDRSLERDMLPYCRASAVAVLAYSPLAHGLLTGKLSPERVFTGDDLRRADPRFSAEGRRRALAALERLRPMAAEYNLSISQFVIAWTAARPGVTHVLVGARDEGQARENAAAGSVALAGEDLEALNQAAEGLALSA